MVYGVKASTKHERHMRNDKKETHAFIGVLNVLGFFYFDNLGFI